MELERQEKGSPEEVQLEHILAQAEKLKETQRESEPSVGRQRISPGDERRDRGRNRGDGPGGQGGAGRSCWAGQGICRRRDTPVDVRLVGGESENAEVDKRDDKEPISIEPVDSVQVNVESMQSERDGKAR